MSVKMKIDFVSDVACPWCAVGLGALEQAIERLGEEVKVELQFQPFELNPDMPAGGQDLDEHLTEKYGSTPEQRVEIRDTIRRRGEEVGFTFSAEGRGRIYNTLDSHRLLHWAKYTGRPGSQYALKKALLEAYQGRAENIESPEVLLAAVAKVGLPVGQARAILQSKEYETEVRALEEFYRRAGIHAVPAVIINDRHLISGGQPTDVFERALREIAAATL
jgi:predicted DsbA family dithiol-disulfide isomerase